MCGIAGCIISKDLDEEKIRKMYSIMSNRGPDFQSHVKFESDNKIIYLFHSRLKILDLNARSNQPFQKKQFTLIFNGEIYNYIELKKILEDKGHKFYTSSDTEVLITAYIEYGSELEKYLEGMWAFAIWDNKLKKLFLSRDRFSEKPLYYFNDRNFYFGSEIKYIKEFIPNDLTVNYETIKKNIIYGYKSIYKKYESYYNNILQLQGSHILNIDLNNRIEIKKYWAPSINEKKTKFSNDELKEYVYDLLKKSLKIRLRSDTSLAFMLSGGVDSSSLVYIASKEFNLNCDTYSVIDDDERYNEEKNIDTTVKDLGLNNFKINLKEKFSLSMLTDLINYHDQPVCTINFVSHSILQKFIKDDGHKVVISGTGADEVFSGYYDHYNCYLRDLEGDENYDVALQNWKKYFSKNIQNKYLKDPEIFKNYGNSFNLYRFYNNENYRNFLLDPNFKVDLSDYNYDAKSLLKTRKFNEMFFEVIPITLQNEDLNSMFYSLENRSPYLDTELLEGIDSLPTEYFIQDGYNKWLLRNAMKGKLNEKIRTDRVKKGFNASVESFIDLSDNNIIDYLLSENPIFDLINKDKFSHMIKNNDFYNNEDKKFLFNFLTSKIFLELNS